MKNIDPCYEDKLRALRHKFGRQVEPSETLRNFMLNAGRAVDAETDGFLVFIPEHQKPYISVYLPQEKRYCRATRLLEKFIDICGVGILTSPFPATYQRAHILKINQSHFQTFFGTPKSYM